jgi:hypothetical protein
MREETPSIKRSFLSIVMVVEILGIEELSPWTSFVHHMLGALMEDWRYIIFLCEAFMCAFFFHMLIFVVGNLVACYKCLVMNYDFIWIE